MCEQCLAKTEIWPDILDGWHLVRATKNGHMIKAGQWGLLIQNDPEIIWNSTPRIEPADNEVLPTSDGNPELPDNADEWDEWFEAATDLDQKVRLDIGLSLGLAASKAGYDPDKHGYLYVWLFDYLGKWIVNHKPENHYKHNPD